MHGPQRQKPVQGLRAGSGQVRRGQPGRGRSPQEALAVLTRRAIWRRSLPGRARRRRRRSVATPRHPR